MPVLRSSRTKSALRVCDNQSESVPIPKRIHSRRFTEGMKSTFEKSNPVENEVSQLSDRVLRRCSATSKETITAKTLNTAVLPPGRPKPQVSRVTKHETLKMEASCHRAKPTGCTKKTPSSGGRQPPSTVDPYALDASSDSGDEKENIDPNASKQRTKGHRVQTSLKGTFLKSDSVYHPRQQPVDDGLQSPQPLTGRPTVSKLRTIAKSTPKADPPHSNTPPVGATPSALLSKTLAQEARRKSATATIYLPLPRPSGTPAVGLSAGPLASTPALLPPGRPAVPLTQLTPVNPPSADVHDPLAESVAPEAIPPASTAVLSDSSARDSKRSNETRASGSSASTTTTGGRRRRHVSESDTQAAYSSWLDDFNAQLEQFESHELTVDGTSD